MQAPSIGLAPPRGRAAVKLGAPPLWLAALIAVVAFGALDLSIDSHRLMKALGDTDDATRLTQVRDLLAGAPWTDTTLPRVGAPHALVSHWSRLIDAPLAVMIAALTPLLGTARAELLTRFCWPLAVLWPLVYLIGRESAARGGKQAGYLAVIFAGTAITGLVQYLPGRIDHHNVMILGAVSGTLMLLRCLEVPRLGWAAGAMLGLGTAIGYEALALTAASLAISGLYALTTLSGLAGLARAAAAMTAVLTMALVATTAPGNLLTSHCDALSLNLVLLTASGALGLGIIQLRGRGWDMRLRLAVPALTVAAGLALYGAAQPACLKGPFGELDPQLGPVWLGSVIETQSVLYQLKASPASGIVFLLFAAMGLAAAMLDWRRRHAAEAALLIALLTAAVALACWQIKLIPYATFLAVMPIATTLARLGIIDRTGGLISPQGQRTLAVASLNQLVLVALISPMAAALMPANAEFTAWAKRAKVCVATEAAEALAELPAGLMLADRDFGPFIVATTGHRVTAAPYHRLDQAIIANERIMNGAPQAAEAQIRKLGVAYVTLCDGIAKSEPKADGKGATEGFRAQLMAGHTPAFLEPVTLSKPTPFMVWRVRQ